jgi:polyisoprenoid-binding protein YceI
MIKCGFLVLTLVTIVNISYAQDRFFTKNGKISFYSKAPLEDIEAHNKSVTAVLDTKTGNLQFAVQMKGFEFEKALMEEHFNESYVESDKYPRAEFKGQVTNNSAIDYTKDGDYNARVKGLLTIRGETREVESVGKITVRNGRLAADASFNIQLSDFKINIPKLVKDKISNTVKIDVDCTLEPLKS